MMMRKDPAIAAVAIDSAKATRFTLVGLIAIRRKAWLSCDTARMARPMKVRDR